MSTKESIRQAWKKYQSTEKHGLEFGKACFEYREQNGVSKGGYGSKGKGLSEILTVLGIPRHKADYWTQQYEFSVGKTTQKTNFNPEGTRGFKNKPSLNLFLRRLMAIGAEGITSPFPSMADRALHECGTEEVANAVIFNLTKAIERLTEYRAKFKEIQNA